MLHAAFMADEGWGFMLEPARVIQYVFMYMLLVSWDKQLNYTWFIQTWTIYQHEASKTKTKKRHVIENTSWNMVNCVTHDHMARIAVYAAAERQDLRSSWWRRDA